MPALHAQISEVLKSRLTLRHAQFLARPEFNGDGSISWWSDGVGSVVAADSLGALERQEIQERARQIEADVLSLADKLQHEGEAAAAYARILRAVVGTLAQGELFSVEGKPLRAAWGLGTSDSPVTARVEAVPLAVSKVPAKAWPLAAAAAAALLLLTMVALVVAPWALNTLAARLDAQASEVMRRNDLLRQQAAAPAATSGSCEPAASGNAGNKASVHGR